MVNDSCLRGRHSFYFFSKMEEDIPFVTANHYSLEHKQREQCQVQVERTKYPGGSKKKKKEKEKEGEKKKLWKRHGSHMKTTIAELTSSRTRCEEEHQR